MADAAEIITPSGVAKSDFSSIRIPGDTSLKDFQVELKNIAGEQKNILTAVKNAVEDFFKNELFKDTSERQQTELANRLCKQIFSNLKDLKNQTSSVDLGKVSAIVISDNPKATLDKYVKEEFDKIKDSAEFKEALDDSTFTESELESFEKKVLEAIAKTVVEQARSYKEDFKKDLPKSSQSEFHSMAEFSIRHKKEIEDGIVFPVLDFKTIESKVLTSVKKRITQISSKISNPIQPGSQQRQLTSSIVFRGSSLNNLFGQNTKNKKWYDKSIKEHFLKANSVLKKVSKFMEHPIRNVKRVIVKWGKMFAAKVSGMLNYFFPITEVMFLIGVASKIVQFSFKILKGIQTIISWSWNAVKFITRNTFGVLYKVLKKVTSYKLTRDIFKAFFRSYIGAYVLGMAIGFFYYHIRKIMPKLKEWYAKLREKLDPFITFFQETADKIWNVVGKIVFTAKEIVIAFDYYFKNSEDKSLSGAFQFITGNLRDSDGNLIFEDGSNIFDTIEKARQWISRTFTIQNMASIKKAAITSVTGGVASLIGAWAGAKLGAMIGSVAGPFGTIAGGIIGAFVGSTVGPFLTDLINDTFNDAQKVNMTENAYARYLRTDLGIVTKYSNIGDRLKDEEGKYRTDSDFGYVLDALERQSAGEEFTDEDVERFNKIGLKIEKGKAPSYELQRLRYINNINESTIIGEIQSVVDLFNLLKDSDYSFDEDDFKDERFKNAARTTNLALTSSGEQYLGDGLKNDRQYLIFRLSRAYQIYDLFKNKNYMEEYRGRLGIVRPKEFLDLYDEVSFIPSSQEQIVSKRLHPEVQKRLKSLGKFKGFWDSWSKNAVGESQAKTIDWLNEVFITASHPTLIIDYQTRNAIREGDYDTIVGDSSTIELNLDEFKKQRRIREDFGEAINKLETETDNAIQKNNQASLRQIASYRERLLNILNSLEDIDPNERIILIKRIEELEKKTNQASALLDSGREPSEF